MVTTLQNELQIRPLLRACTRTRLFLLLQFVYIILNETLLHKTDVFCVVLLGAHFDICRGGLKDLYRHGILGPIQTNWVQKSRKIKISTNFDKRMSKNSKRDHFYCLLEAITCRKCLNNVRIVL